MMLNALFPRVKCDDVEQIAKGKVPPDPAFVAQIDLADAVRAPKHKSASFRAQARLVWKAPDTHGIHS